MAANNEAPSVAKICNICRKPYDDPKLLPCIHAFCKKCLHTTAGINTQENGGGGTMPCPICKEPFSIPPEGFDGLPTDPFLSRLAKEDTPEDRRCAACLDRTRETNETDALLAVASCSECQRKAELSGEAQTLNGGVSEARDCDIHPLEKLTLYCIDCEEVMCASCFDTAHQKHKLQNTKDFRVALQSSRLSYGKKVTLNRVKELEQGLLKLHHLRKSVHKRRESIEELLEKHVQSLIKDIESEELRLEAESERIGKEHELHLSWLGTFESYCKEILARGSPDDICGAMPKLKRRSDELVKRLDLAEELQLRTPRYVPPEFRGSDLDEFLGEDGFNIIGYVIGFGRQKSTKLSRKEKIDGLNERIGELKYDLNQTRETNLNLQKEVEELKQTRLENLNLQKEVEELKQRRQENLNLQKEVEELKQTRQENLNWREASEHSQRSIEAPEELILLVDERDRQSRTGIHVASLQQQLERMAVAELSLERQMHRERTHNQELNERLSRRIENLEVEQGLNRRVEELEVQQRMNRRVEELEVQQRMNRRVEELEVQQILYRRVDELEVQQNLSRRVEELEVQQRMNRRVEELEVQQMQNRMEIGRLSDEISQLKKLVPSSNLRESRRYEINKEFSVQVMNERNVNVDMRVTSNTAGLLEIELSMTACDTTPNVVRNNDLISTKTLRHRVKVDDLDDPFNIFSCPQKLCIYIIDMNSKKYL